MERIFVSTILAILLVGCFYDENIKFNANSITDQNALDERTRKEFLQKPIVTKFKEEGLIIDCERSICGQITDASLQVLQQYKTNFLQKKERIKSIYLVNENDPSYSYKIESVFIPAQLTEIVLYSFFEVLNMIQDFEMQVGFRVEFSSSRYLKSSITPLLQILKDNSHLLKAEAHRIKLLNINSVYSAFSPRKSIVMLKIDDVKKSFSELWSFMSLFYKAQDLFGNVFFGFEKNDAHGIATMEKLFQHPEIFQPLLAKLQDRSIVLFEMDDYFYSDAHSPLMDMGVSSSFDEKYLEEVFKDQIRILELSHFIGERIEHSEAIIVLHGHKECLDKIDSIKSNIKEKVSSLEALLITFNHDVPVLNSSFSKGKLILNCDQTASEMKAVIDQI